VINPLNPSLINIIKSSSRKSSNKSITKYNGTNNSKNANISPQSNTELNQTTNGINTNVVQILNEPNNEQINIEKINGIDLFETTKVKKSESKTDEVELHQFEPNLNKRIVNLRKLSAKNKNK
jgi:hypothetical protein